MLNSFELLLQYKVNMDYRHVFSSLVYPMDSTKKFVMEGYANNDDVTDFLKVASYQLSVEVKPSSIANKYAIPFLQVFHMHTLKTYFYYQHDSVTWVISLTETSAKYLG